MNDIRTYVYADRGPVADAVRILAAETTLAELVTVHEGNPLAVEVTGDIPFEVWGSGTQGLWLLLCSIAYTGETVSLYGVASRLDRPNTLAAGRAMATLFGVRYAAASEVSA